MSRIAKPKGNSSAAVDPILLGNDFFKIRFTHLATGNDVAFKGWVTEFSDQFSSAWTPETVYGRMDPLVTFGGTQRQISLGFDVVSKSAAEAEANLIRVNQLIEFLYPVYEGGSRSNQNTLKAAPLIGLKWTNLIAGAQNGEKLVGYLDGVTYAPSMDQGGFMGTPQEAGAEELQLDLDYQVGTQTFKKQLYERTLTSQKVYIPKTLSLSLSYTVIHTHLMGWANGKFGGSDSINGKFPNSAGKRMESTEFVQRIVDTQGKLVTEIAAQTSATESANEHDVLASNE